MTLTSRYPTFLYEALKLQESKIPIDLDSGIIQAMIDAYQNGWALVVYNHQKSNRSLQFPNSIPLIGDTEFPPSPVGVAPERKQKKVLAMDTLHSLQAAQQFDLKYRRINGENQEVIIRNLPASAGTNLRNDWLNDWMDRAQATLFIPQGWQLVLDLPGTGVAEDVIEIQILWAEIPGGFDIGQS